MFRVRIHVVMIIECDLLKFNTRTSDGDDEDDTSTTFKSNFIYGAYSELVTL